MPSQRYHLRTQTRHHINFAGLIAHQSWTYPNQFYCILISAVHSAEVRSLLPYSFDIFPTEDHRRRNRLPLDKTYIYLPYYPAQIQRNLVIRIHPSYAIRLGRVTLGQRGIVTIYNAVFALNDNHPVLDLGGGREDWY